MNRALLIAGDAEAEAFSLGVAASSIGREDSIAFVQRRTCRAGWSNHAYERWVARLEPDERAIVAKEMRTPTGGLLALARKESSAG